MPKLTQEENDLMQAGYEVHKQLFNHSAMSTTYKGERCFHDGVGGLILPIAKVLKYHVRAPETVHQVRYAYDEEQLAHIVKNTERQMTMPDRIDHYDLVRLDQTPPPAFDVPVYNPQDVALVERLETEQSKRVEIDSMVADLAFGLMMGGVI